MKILENNNRKFIRVLIKNCLKANRERNKIAVCAVMFTAALFMALATIYEGSQITLRNQMLRQAGTKFMVSVKNLTKEEAEKLVVNPLFAEAGMERYVSAVLNPELSNMNALAGWADETLAEGCFMKLKEGHYPQREDEIACDSEVLRLLGIPYRTGESFVMQYTAGEKVLEKKMTVCGIWESVKHEQSASLLVSETFVEQTFAQYDKTAADEIEKSYHIRGSFASEKNIREKLNLLVKEMGYDPDAERGEKGFLIHHVNPVYETRSMDSWKEALSALAGVLLILLSGYLIIYNIFKISIEKDIRLYGQLKTIGASPKQLKRMVTGQGMALSFAGIPAGLVSGWLFGNWLLPAVMEDTFADEFTFLVPSVWVWLLSAVFTLATVRISCSRPGRIAGKISPVESLKYYGSDHMKKTRKRGRDSRHRIISMALSNLGRNKGKTILVVLSLALSPVLLNSALNYAGGMDKETYVRHESITDFDITSGDYFKNSSENYRKTVPGDCVQKLGALDGVKDFGLVYLNMLPEEELTERQEDLGKVIRINGKETPDDITKYDRNRMLYGMNEHALSMTEVIEGSIDYNKLCTGEYVVIEGFLSDRGEYLYEEQEFHAGDVIEVEAGGKKKEYTVMAVAGGAYSLNMCYSAGGYEAIVFAEPVFLDMFPDMQEPIHCLFNTEEGTFDKVMEETELLADRRGLSVFTRLTAEEEFGKMKHAYRMMGIVVSLVFAVMGILNLVNVILTGVIARKREFAAMRSTGMTKKQLLRLLVYEGMMYAAAAAGAAVITSGILSVTLVKNLMADVWYMKYRFTVVTAVAASVSCLLFSAGISAVTGMLWNRNATITEQMRE